MCVAREINGSGEMSALPYCLAEIRRFQITTVLVLLRWTMVGAPCYSQEMSIRTSSIGWLNRSGHWIGWSRLITGARRAAVLIFWRAGVLPLSYLVPDTQADLVTPARMSCSGFQIVVEYQ